MMDRPQILIVDDESHIVNVLGFKLRAGGCEVLTAEDGEQALRIACLERPDLIITDYQMPFMSGLELCLKLREQDMTRDIPALMLTARGFSLNPGDLAGTNIAAVFSKPFGPRELVEQAKAVLDRPVEALEPTEAI